MPIWSIRRGTFASDISEGWRAIRKLKSTGPNPENWGASCQMREAVTGITLSRRKSFSSRPASSRNATSGIRCIHPARNRQVGSESSNQDPLNLRVLASTHFRLAAFDREASCLMCVSSLERSSTLSSPGSFTRNAENDWQSFVTKGLDRIEPSGFPGRINSKHHANERAKRERGNNPKQ